MKVGFMGLGKLGLPCALAAEQRGHEVMGYDISEAVCANIAARKIPYREAGAAAALLLVLRRRCAAKILWSVS